MAGFDVDAVRKDFPILERRVHGERPLVYLDSAASSQKPRQVLDAERDYYERHHANVHRGIHALAEEATALYEGARDKVRAFVAAPAREEIVFTKNSTEALNLVANVLGLAGLPGSAGGAGLPGSAGGAGLPGSAGGAGLPGSAGGAGLPGSAGGAAARYGVGPGDEILITEMEHHSNIVPWQLLAQRSGATLRWFGITDSGRLDLSRIDELLTERTKVVSLVHVSNILGTLNPVAEVARRAHRVGALVVVDASQSVPQLPVDVTALGADFVAFTGHKMLGPTGIGVLWGRRELLEALPPFLGGGEMIETVTMQGSTYAGLPHKYEAGTPPIAQAVALGAAVDYLSALGMDAVAAHERDITAYALARLAEVPELTIVGPDVPVDRGGAISFTLGTLHPHDVGQVLDDRGIAVRVGHHCARPVCARFGIPATTRASFYVYSTRDDVDALVAGLHEVREVFCRP